MPIFGYNLGLKQNYKDRCEIFLKSIYGEQLMGQTHHIQPW